MLDAMREFRGCQRVTDPNPEEKYQALKNNGKDLTELAKKGKLDPIIKAGTTISGASYR